MQNNTYNNYYYHYTRAQVPLGKFWQQAVAWIDASQLSQGYPGYPVCVASVRMTNERLIPVTEGNTIIKICSIISVVK